MSVEIVKEWIKKAEEDWEALMRLRSGKISEIADIITFHSQQCAEKYLKALIQKNGKEPPRTHHLSILLDELISDYPELESLRVSCESLTPYSVNFRYPGEESSKEDAVEAIKLSRKIRKVIREKLS